MNESAPGFSDILTHWSFDLPWIVIIASAAALYLRAARNPAAHRGRRPHARWKTVAFLAGIAALAVGVLSPLDHYGDRVLWLNFTSLLVITMIAPPLILLGSPLTLAFRVSSPRGRRRLRTFYRGGHTRVITFPAVSWLLFAAATYIWQFTPLTDVAARHEPLRDVQQASLLAVSLLFWNPALCADPVRWRIPLPLRALYIFVEMTHKGLFGGMFLSMSHPMHHYFVTHAPSWAPSAMNDQRIAILVLWLGGNVVFLAVLIGLVVRWVQYETRNTARTDARLAAARAAASSHRAALDRVFQKPF